MTPKAAPSEQECTFCRIAAGELTADFVFRNDDVVAFLDLRPVFKGHVLVIPRRHVDTLTDLPHELLAPLFGTTQRIAAAVVAGLDADGSFVAINNVVSQSQPHLHVHVVPRRRKDGLRGFFWPRQRYDDEAERAGYAARIAAAVT
ncbi:MAG TPA: HIT family protein [Acidimicrobiia bacterium]